jgi:hypothetical protein
VSSPTIQNCKVFGSRDDCGILICDQEGAQAQPSGKIVLQNNEILGNALAGIEIRDKADVALRENLIHNGKDYGVLIHGNATVVSVTFSF